LKEKKRTRYGQHQENADNNDKNELGIEYNFLSLNILSCQHQQHFKLISKTEDGANLKTQQITNQSAGLIISFMLNDSTRALHKRKNIYSNFKVKGRKFEKLLQADK